MSSRDQIAQALAAQAVAPPAQAQVPQQPDSPWALNQQLAQAAAPNQLPMHPLIAALMQKFGFLNMMRNSTNQQVQNIPE